MQRSSYLPPVVERMRPNERPKIACAQCPQSLWYAHDLGEGKFQVVCHCKVMHRPTFDSVSITTRPIVICDAIFEEPDSEED